ncbi:hypothetical protein [Oceanibium sediminis]|uniref:hypothetical protein n=1 Tax=Oceanibium sediminis TaxID=2026339 RepID=UPI000DD3B718|nr:hypothetical protein [Oceanibium sediminis]
MYIREVALVLCVLAGAAAAGSPEVTAVKATQDAAGWRFDVTVRHGDTGWDHYADGWYILSPDGAELGYRKLLHPHQNEQPFTRSLSGVAIPEGLDRVHVQAHDSVHGRGEVLVVPLRGR